MTTKKVLFVCAGNICRSPMAEAIFVHLVKEQGLQDQFEIEGAGTGGWHIGEKPDHRTIKVLEKHGMKWISHARQVSKSDFSTFDHILAMDVENERNLLRVGAPRDKVRLMLSLDPEARRIEVPDPYYGGMDDFEEVFDLLLPACKRLLQELKD